MLIHKKIICPTDFSEASLKGLAQAVSLAATSKSQSTDVELCLVHVEPSAKSNAKYLDRAQDAYDSAQRRAEAIKNLCNIIEKSVPSNISARPILRQGDAAQEIIHCAAEENADLIVLTAHGATGLDSAEVAGNVALGIMEKSPCPIYLLPNSLLKSREKTCNGTCATCRGTDAAAHATHAPVSGKELYLDGD